MNFTFRNLGLSVCTAGIIGAGALGLAGTAAAATQTPIGPGYSYSPEVKAHPAPTAKPGWHNNHGPARIANLQNR
ncbi:MAG: hypothetical protein ACRDUB_10055 [Mycobacterium sp.]